MDMIGKMHARHAEKMSISMKPGTFLFFAFLVFSLVAADTSAYGQALGFKPPTDASKAADVTPAAPGNSTNQADKVITNAPPLAKSLRALSSTPPIPTNWVQDTNHEDFALPESVPDPIEPVNRVIWSLNKSVMIGVVK